MPQPRISPPAEAKSVEAKPSEPPGARAFLEQAGWGTARLKPLAGDASFRRYFRVIDGGRSAMLMDAPPPHEDPRPFARIARQLTAGGFHPPEILASDLDQGLLLLEDLGDTRMQEAIAATPEQEAGIYADAVDLLVALHRDPPLPDLAPYDLKELVREVDLFVEWYAPAVGMAGDRPAWDAAWAEVLARLPEANPVTVLRDYHAENIMLRTTPEGRDGDARGRLALLDFQDALAGHPAYDLVSLLQDARRTVPEALEQAMKARYVKAASGETATEDTGDGESAIDLAYAVLGAQRNTKILGIFARLWRRDGKPGYLPHMPRVWTYLERDLAHPALAPVARWFDAHARPETRAAFWCEAQGAHGQEGGR